MLGASVIACSAQAGYSSSYSYDYEENSPQKASLTISLSGDCSAKIDLPVTKVDYGNEYSDNNVAGQIDKDSSYAYFNFLTSDSDIYVAAFNYAESAGEKVTEKVKGGKRSVSFNIVGSGYWDVQAYFDSLAGGGYDSQIKCKDGGTLQQQMMPGWGPYYDARGNKVSGSLTHSNSTSDPSTGTYKVKFSSTGTMQAPGQCALKGTLGSDYSFVCAPSKKITIKVTATAQGDSTLVL
ncbi:MAG: hypothetical protein R3E61_03995 [Pseudomonadales bacterium]